MGRHCYKYRASSLYIFAKFKFVMGSVQDGGDIPLTPTSTLDAVRAVLEQCRSEMIKGIEGSNLQGFSREQRWLMLKGEEALLTLQEVMPTGAMRFVDYEHKDTPLFSFSVIYVVDCKFASTNPPGRPTNSPLNIFRYMLQENHRRVHA